VSAEYFTAAQVRELDRLAIESGIPGFELMQRAGKAAFNALRWQWPRLRTIIVVCGTGNNGGDGFIIAGLARAAGLAVTVHVIGARSAIKGDALRALEYAEGRHLLPEFCTELALMPPPTGPDTVIVDALLGTGLGGPVRLPQRNTIEAINRSGLPVLAVDIPSGLCSDTGSVLGACVAADLTVTFIGRKLGLVAGEGPACCGKVMFDDLGVPPEIYRRIPATLDRYQDSNPALR